MTLQQLYVALFAGGVALLASIIATRIASRVGFPSLLLFLAVGVRARGKRVGDTF